MAQALDRHRGATYPGPLTGLRVIQMGKGWAVARKTCLLLLYKRSSSIDCGLYAGIGPVEDEPVFDLAQLGGPSPELKQGTGQVLLHDLLAREPDWQRDLDQAGGRFVVNRAVVVLEHLAGDDLGAGRQRAVD